MFKKQNKYILVLVCLVLLSLLFYHIKVEVLEGFDIDNLYNHNICGKTPPFPSLTLFSNNISSPNCCGSSQYSSGGGCVCMCEEQVNYLLKRGGNIS